MYHFFSTMPTRRYSVGISSTFMAHSNDIANKNVYVPLYKADFCLEASGDGCKNLLILFKLRKLIVFRTFAVKCKVLVSILNESELFQCWLAEMNKTLPFLCQATFEIGRVNFQD